MLLTEHIGLRMKEIRLEAGFKQKDLAKVLNILPSQLSMYEQGKREPSISFLGSFTNYFNIRLSQFFIFDELDIPVTEINKEYTTLIKGLKNVLHNLENKNLQLANNVEA